MNDKNSPIFRFDKESIKMHLDYDREYYRKLKKTLNGYIFPKMEELGYFQKLESLEDISISNINEKEGKNYNWSVVEYENVKMLIRRRQSNNHFTVFVNQYREEKRAEKNLISAFTFFTNLGNMDLGSEDEYAIDGIRDEYYENPFMDFNKYLKPMIEVIKERSVYWLYNSACLPREKHIDIKVAFEGREHILSYDETFCCYEEIDSFHTCLYAENDMLQKLEEVKERIGEQFDHQYKIHNVRTTLKDEYYHGVGIDLIDKDGKTSFQDVYSLTMFYYDKVFIPEPPEQNEFTIELVNSHRYVNAVIEYKLESSFILPTFKEIGFETLVKAAKEYKFIKIPSDEKGTMELEFEICKADRNERVLTIVFRSIT